jgi:hypothetical protein
VSNEGSPNPSAIVVNLSEDTRQANPDKLHVTTHELGNATGSQTYYGAANVPAGANVVLVTRTVPPNVVMHITGFDGQGDADGKFYLKVSGAIVLLARNSAAEPTAKETLEPAYKAAAGDVVTLEVTNPESAAYAYEGVVRGWDESLV